MELFYCVLIGILGVVFAYWLGRFTTRNENERKLQEMIENDIFQNNQEYVLAEMKLRGVKKELERNEEKIANADIVKDAETKAQQMLMEAQGKADKLINDANKARKNMLKEIQNLRELIAERIQGFIDGNKPMTAEENLNKLLKKPKGNRNGKFPNFQE